VVKFANDAYNGLYSEDSGVTLFSSGSFTITTTAGGKYSAALMLICKKYSFSGQFNPLGRATNSILRGTLRQLTVELVLDKADTDRMTGRVTDGVWSAPILADRATFNAKTNPAPQAGTYTLAIPGAADGASNPEGYSFGAVKVNAAGLASFAGTLADGTKFTQSATLSKNADWPFYKPLYSNVGSIIGWLQFTNTATDDLTGLANWTKLQQPSSKYYPAGFAVESAARGSKYLPPPTGEPVLNLAVGDAHLTGGNLPQSVTNQITLQANNKFGSLSGVRLSFSVTLGNGLFTGSFVSPVTGKSVAVKGAVLQKQNIGCGFFVGTNQSGLVYFSP